MEWLLNRRRFMVRNSSDKPVDYLTFTALENGTFTLTIASTMNTSHITDISYSTDGGNTWIKTNNQDNTVVEITTPTITAGNTVMWKGNASQISRGSAIYSRFSSTGKFDVSGYITSLLSEKNYRKVKTASANYIFSNLFANSLVVSAENLIIPYTTLSSNIFESTFNTCGELITPPVLPATTIASNCYKYMFNGCSKLVSAPALPATQLYSGCYTNMFSGTTSLLTPPILSSTALAANCYDQMFNGSGITTAPELPATTMYNYCYRFMFQDCKGLTSSPILPASTLVTGCYSYMFRRATNLNEITILATDISATNCLQDWVANVNASGTFKKINGVTYNTGNSGIPSGWTVETVTV